MQFGWELSLFLYHGVLFFDHAPVRLRSGARRKLSAYFGFLHPYLAYFEAWNLGRTMESKPKSYFGGHVMKGDTRHVRFERDCNHAEGARQAMGFGMHGALRMITELKRCIIEKLGSIQQCLPARQSW